MLFELKLEKLKNQNNLTQKKKDKLLRLRIVTFNAERPFKIMFFKELLKPILFKDKEIDELVKCLQNKLSFCYSETCCLQSRVNSLIYENIGL